MKKSLYANVMKAELITIGDELLIGQVVDTNAAWIGSELATIGIGLQRITTVSDDASALIDAIHQALGRVDLLLLTGGLGPTNDDVTKTTLCRYFQSSLVFNEEVNSDIMHLLQRTSKPMNALTASQSMVPHNARIIRNAMGTAPIFWFETDKGQVIVSMPGVPYEMKHVMTQSILPQLQQLSTVTPLKNYHFTVMGYPESALAIHLAEWEKELPQGVKLAYLPQFSVVRLRLTTSLPNPDTLLEQSIQQLRQLLKKAIIAEEDLPIEGIVGKWLQQNNKSLAVAESCTGGFLAHRITTVPGSSTYFRGGVVAYHNDVKENLLKVDSEILRKHGAVSREVVEEMAVGVTRRLSADYGIAISGIAGPGGGTDAKPVGTVWIAIQTPKGCCSYSCFFPHTRMLVIERSTQYALLQLIRLLREEDENCSKN